MSIEGNNILAKDVDYDFIISDTYDYIDKLIGFRLGDILFAVFSQYNDRFADSRAVKISKYIKYGTDNERYILLLRYGLTFEDIEKLDVHIEQVSEAEIIVKDSINGLPEKDLQPIRRYI